MGFNTAASLSELGRKIQQQFLIISSPRTTSADAPQVDVPVSNFEFEFQRFQLWSVNLGLFDMGHSSLEYRLQDAAETRDYTGGLLEDLLEELEEGNAIKSGSRPPFEETDVSQLVDDTQQLAIGHGEQYEANSHQDTDDEVSTEDGDEPEIVVRLNAVVETLDRLFRVARSIRNPATRSTQGHRNVYKSIEPEYRDQTVQRLVQYESIRICDLICQMRRDLNDYQEYETPFLNLLNEDNVIIKRLAKANTWRRQRFIYWRERKERSTNKAVPIPPTVTSQSITQAQPGLDVQIRTAMSPDFLPTAAYSMPSSVTRVRAEQLHLGDKKSAASNVTRTPSVRGPSGEKIDWPAVPAGQTNAGYFECPYCFNICPDRYRSPQGWRAHILHDLRPYCCTYAECDGGGQLYDSWADWTSHELLVHNSVWTCLDHPEFEFHSRDEYSDHVRQQHRDQVEALLADQILDARKTGASESGRLCPFCLIEQHNLESMQRHLAWHLESIALLALPRSTGGEGDDNSVDLNSSQSGRANQDSRAGEADNLSLPAAEFDDGIEINIPGTDNLTTSVLREALASGALPDVSGVVDPRLILDIPEDGSTTQNLQKGDGMEHEATSPFLPPAGAQTPVRTKRGRDSDSENESAPDEIKHRKSPGLSGVRDVVVERSPLRPAPILNLESDSEGMRALNSSPKAEVSPRPGSGTRIPTSVMHTEAQWESQKKNFYDLYIGQNLTLKSTMERMKDDHGFAAPESQWRRKAQLWGFRKYVSREERLSQLEPGTSGDRSLHRFSQPMQRKQSPTSVEGIIPVAELGFARGSGQASLPPPDAQILLTTEDSPETAENPIRLNVNHPDTTGFPADQPRGHAHGHIVGGATVVAQFSVTIWRILFYLRFHHIGTDHYVVTVQVSTDLEPYEGEVVLGEAWLKVGQNNYQLDFELPKPTSSGKRLPDVTELPLVMGLVDPKVNISTDDLITLQITYKFGGKLRMGEAHMKRVVVQTFHDPNASLSYSRFPPGTI